MVKKIKNHIRDFLKNAQRPLVVLLGPTASGKTALSLEIAREFSGEIISADSRQVYKYMNIGTDKIPLEKRNGIAHYCIDLVEPTERYTVADFKREAEAHADEILSRRKLPMLVGGTGLYIRAITENFEIPPENPAVRRQLMDELKQKGVQHMHEKLAQLDPTSAQNIHPSNALYIIRALEIVLTTGKPKGEAKNPPRFDCLMIGLSWEREKLFARINERVDEQIRRGLIEETADLLRRGFAPTLASMKSLGYREMGEHLRGVLSLEQAAELIKKNTRNFSKRQMTWFKKDKDAIWFVNT